MGMKLTALAWLVFDDRCDDFHSGRTRKVGALLLDTIRRIARRLRDESCGKSETENEQASQNPNWWHSLHRRLLGNYPPAKPGALDCEPLKAALPGSLTRPRRNGAT